MASAPRKPPLSFWARLARNAHYRVITETLLKTERRRFWLLASGPLLWIFLAHLGPILQMLKISFLDAYPPTVGATPQWTKNRCATNTSRPRCPPANPAYSAAVRIQSPAFTNGFPRFPASGVRGSREELRNR